MKLSEAIAGIRATKPNQYDDGMLMGWISELDGQVFDTVLSVRDDATENPTPYGMDDLNSRLLVPFPYDQIYLHWLSAKIDFANSEFDRYSNTMAMFNQTLESFSASYSRKYRQKSPGEIRAM